MKIRNILYSAAVAAMTIALGSCSNIGEDERLIEVEIPQAQRAVLIEDFTGQFCPNCPNAADEIETLSEAYGSDKIIAVAIHSGPQGFAGGTEEMPGLMTDLGNEYYNGYGIEYQPQGVIDKDGKKLAYTDWAAAVRSELQKVALLNIEVTNDYAEATRKLTVKTNVETVKGVDGTIGGTLQLWLVEDGITSIQSMPDGSYNMSYTHNHVFRDAVNGKQGEPVSMTEDTPAEKTYTYDIPANWKPEHLSVVAFVYNGSGVLQVVKKPLISEQNN